MQLPNQSETNGYCNYVHHSGPKPEFGDSEAHDKVLTRIYSDLFFDAPVCMGVELHQQKNSTYLLKYVHRGQMKLLNVFSGGKLNNESAGHGDDVFLMFGSSAVSLKLDSAAL